MKYMLLIYEDDADRVAHMDERMPTCFAYAEAMKKAGIYVAGEPLTVLCWLDDPSDLARLEGTLTDDADERQ